MAQPGEMAPSALLRQQLRQQVERMHGREQWQQVRAPELGGAELPARATKRPSVPMFVDEVVGDVWIEPVEQLVGAGHWKAFHGDGAYRFSNVSSRSCFNLQFFAG
jgi:hypothetical protein